MISLEKLRIGLRESLARGDYERRKVDPRIDAFASWVAAEPIPQADAERGVARLEALRARALVLTLYCSGLRARRQLRSSRRRCSRARNLAKRTSGVRATASGPSFSTRRRWQRSVSTSRCVDPPTIADGCSSRMATGAAQRSAEPMVGMGHPQEAGQRSRGRGPGVPGAAARTPHPRHPASLRAHGTQQWRQPVRRTGSARTCQPGNHQTHLRNI